MHRDLARTHTAKGAGVLPPRPHTAGRGLRVPGFVHHQHHVLTGKVVDHHPGHLLASRVVIETRAGEQVLQPVRAGMPERLRQRPAVTGIQLQQQPGGQLPGRLACFTPREAARDRVHRRPERLRPRLLGYRGLHGHRVLIRRYKRS